MSAVAKSSASRSGCHIATMLKPQPIFRRFCDLAKWTRQNQEVGDALIAFVLKMMLGEPQGLVAEGVHLFGDRLGLFEDARQVLVRIAPLVGRCAILAAIRQIDMAGID